MCYTDMQTHRSCTVMYFVHLSVVFVADWVTEGWFNAGLQCGQWTNILKNLAEISVSEDNWCRSTT